MMRLVIISGLSIVLTFLPFGSATCHGVIPTRPEVRPSPFDAGRPIPLSPPRTEGRYCQVQPSLDEKRDDAPRILEAFQKCNNGGTIVFDKSYLIGSPLDLTFLKHVDIVITGEIHFDNSDIYYWAENSFKFLFQNQSTFWKIGGEDVNIYGDLANGKSVIDGHGEPYWQEASINTTVIIAFHDIQTKASTYSSVRYLEKD